MISFCIRCKKTHEGRQWKNAGEGWYCDKWYKPTTPEFVPDRIKRDRSMYAKSLLQPYRGGVASKEYIDTYGTKRINPSDVKKAKNVWKDTLPYGWEKSK